MMQIIPTRKRLSVRGILVDMIMCPICQSAVETIDHIFGGCSLLVDIWGRIAIWWGVHVLAPVSLESIMLWAQSIHGGTGQRKTFDAVINTPLWVLWKFRNAYVFDTSRPKKLVIFDEVVNSSYF